MLAFAQASYRPDALPAPETKKPYKTYRGEFSWEQKRYLSVHRFSPSHGRLFRRVGLPAHLFLSSTSPFFQRFTGLPWLAGILSAQATRFLSIWSSFLLSGC